MNVALPLDRMTASEKLQLIETIWNDLTREPESVPSPDWHGDVLREREQRVAEGKAQFLDIADAKQAVRDLLK
ncbi:addiction module protein [Geoalkalibacter subterraneus]|uniref:Addiction module antitoxin RelB n=1 Tax=Geoalkalibacter subterraneus TaxID=483547 RepID=A0A0B5FJT3_9BACT|nr:addiction module protein [Geoalkalibacter subterraneus]AJF07623.1 addiction module antitoxin RelB [Geoalkalibacter subterraneus]